MTQLIIFDWDGTLVDSEAIIVRCLQYAAQMEGLPIPDDYQAKQVIGLSLEKALQQLFPQGNVLKLAQAYRRCFLSEERPPVALFPEVKPVLQQLSRHYLLAIATGKSRRGLERDLRDTGLNDYFAISRCADETRSKPHPQMIWDILTDLNTPAEQALVVGDTEFDMLMAKEAGCPAIGVSYGVHEPQRLLNCGALAVVDHLSHLSAYLGEDHANPSNEY